MTNQPNSTSNLTPTGDITTCSDAPCGCQALDDQSSGYHAIQCEGHITEGQSFGERREVRVTVLQGGASANGFFYGTQALQAVTRLVEGAQAYLDHNTTASSRSVRDIVGFYRDAIYIAPGSTGGAGNEQGRVEATLHILESAQWLWTLIKEAVALGRPELIGLSIDIFGTLQPLNEAKTGRRL
jgi:hypothetical protein